MQCFQTKDAKPIELDDGIVHRSGDFIEFVLNETITLNYLAVQTTDGKDIEFSLFSDSGRKLFSDSTHTGKDESVGEIFNPPLYGILKIQIPYGQAKRVKKLTAKGCKQPPKPKNCIMPIITDDDISKLNVSL